MTKKALSKKEYSVKVEGNFVKIYNIVKGTKEVLRKERFEKLYKFEAEPKK